MAKKYKVPLEKRKQREQFQKEIYGFAYTVMLYVVIGFVSMFILAGGVALFFSAEANIPQSLAGAGFLTGVIASFITLLVVDSNKKKQTK